MATKPDQSDTDRRALLMQAVGSQYGRLQSARSATIAESSSRSSLYLTSLTGAVVALSFVAQASRFTQTFFVFAVALLPVVFFLGTVTYYRLLQTGIEDVIYARALSKIQTFFGELDQERSGLFEDTSVDQVGLARLGLFALRWQQFLSSAAMVAIVNAVVGGVFIAMTIAAFVELRPVSVIGIGALAAVLIAFAFLRHQWRTWMRVAKALPM